MEVKRINITLTDKLLEEMDAFVAMEKYVHSRSELVALGVRMYMESHRRVRI